MNPEKVSYTSRDEILNRTHPSFESLGAPRVFELQTLSTEAIGQLREAVEVYPKRHRPRRLDRPLHYIASVVTPKGQPIETAEQFPSGKLGVIFLTGVEGTAAGAASMVAEICKRSKDIGFAAALSSSASVDTLNQPFPKNLVERAAYQAAFITRLLKDYPCSKIVLIGYSLGGMELAYTLPILGRLIQANRLQTKIEGMILVQAGGQFRQNIAELALRRLPAVMSLEGEVAEMFPSILDIRRVEAQLEKAREMGDKGLELRLARQLEEMKEKRENPPHLEEEERRKLASLERRLQKLVETWPRDLKLKDSKRIRELKRERLQLLIPAIKQVLQGAEARTEAAPFEVHRRTILATTRHPAMAVARPSSEWVRSQIRGIPVAVIWGEGDPYFPAEEAINRRIIERIGRSQRLKRKHPEKSIGERQRLSEYFSHASAVLEATVAYWPHLAPFTNPLKFAEIITDLIERMGKIQKEAQPPKIRLYY